MIRGIPSFPLRLQPTKEFFSAWANGPAATLLISLDDRVSRRNQRTEYYVWRKVFANSRLSP